MDFPNQRGPDPSVELEVIACTLEDTLAAYRGGASRLEVTVQLDLAGLTPPVELVREMIKIVPLPLRVMLRDRADFLMGDSEAAERLKNKAREFAAMNIDGLVIGFVRDGQIDRRAVECIVDAAQDLPITVHHAIENTGQPVETLRALRNYPTIDRALVSGGGGTLPQRIERLLRYREAFGKERKLIVGGNLTLEMLQPIRNATGISVFHIGRAVRTPEQAGGAVDVVKVKRAVELLANK